MIIMDDKVSELKKVLSGKKSKEPEKPALSETSPELETLQKDLQTAQEEAKQHYDKWLRVMADFENYKKRMTKDHEERLQYANERLLKELIPVLDDFDRVLSHLPDNASEEVTSLIQGVQIVQKHFLAALQKFGVAPMESMHQPFDPHQHEAIGHVVDDSVAPDTVVQEHRKGYLLYDRLLRPAMVT